MRERATSGAGVGQVHADQAKVPHVERNLLQVGADGIVTWVSDAATTCYGIVVGTDMMRWAGLSEHREQGASLLKLQERAVHLEDGRAIWFRPLLEVGQGWLEAVDVSVLVGLQAEREALERSEALGALAAQAASELSTPASVIEGRIALALETVEDVGASRQLQLALEHAHTIAETARTLRLVGHRAYTTAVRTSVREVLADAWLAALPRMRGGTLEGRVDGSLRAGVGAAPLTRALSLLLVYLADGTRGPLTVEAYEDVDMVVLVLRRAGALAVGPLSARDFTFSVVQSLVASMGGEALVAHTPESVQVEVRLPQPSRKLSRAKRAYEAILVVGSPQLPDRLAPILEPEGFVLEWAPSAEEALGRMEEEEFAGVIADLCLDGMSGFSLALALPESLKIPIVLLANSRTGPVTEGVTILVPPLSRRGLLPALGRRVRS